MPAAVEQAQAIANRLSRVAGVAAVALGGSWARGTAHENSDLDLGVYYYPEQPLSTDELGEIAGELDDRHLPNLVTRLGEWGPWINGGGWLLIEGRHVDFLYRDLDKVTDVVMRCVGGKVTCDYQIGHPAGFHNHIYMGEVHFCRVFFDRSGVLRTLKALTVEYPEAMRRAIIDKYLYEASFSIEIAGKPAARADVYYVAGCLFRAIGCLVQVLFALNRRYFVNEKGSLRELDSFALKPANFAAQASSIFSAIGETPQAALERIEQSRVLVQAVNDLCAV
jgi:predicted nucleotidyltransferase